jgi:sec-independent protein translocase protein TatA
VLTGLDNPIHLLLVAVAILLLFGAKRLPEMGRSLGTGMREFKNGITGKELDDGPRETTPVATDRHASQRDGVA